MGDDGELGKSHGRKREERRGWRKQVCKEVVLKVCGEHPVQK